MEHSTFIYPKIMFHGVSFQAYQTLSPVVCLLTALPVPKLFALPLAHMLVCGHVSKCFSSG